MPYEYSPILRLFLKGNPVENRPTTEYSNMRDAAFGISVLGLAEKIDMETQEEKDYRNSSMFKKLPNEITSHYKVK